jgi:hypothetical protein
MHFTLVQMQRTPRRQRRRAPRPQERLRALRASLGSARSADACDNAPPGAHAGAPARLSSHQPRGGHDGPAASAAAAPASGAAGGGRAGEGADGLPHETCAPALASADADGAALAGLCTLLGLHLDALEAAAAAQRGGGAGTRAVDGAFPQAAVRQCLYIEWYPCLPRQ